MASRDPLLSEQPPRIARQDAFIDAAEATVAQGNNFDLHQLAIPAWDEQNEETMGMLESRSGNSLNKQWGLHGRAFPTRNGAGIGQTHSTMPSRRYLPPPDEDRTEDGNSGIMKLAKGPEYNPFLTHSVPRQRYSSRPRGQIAIEIEGLGFPVPQSSDLYRVVFDSFNKPDDMQGRPSLEQLDASHTWSQMSIPSAKNLFVIDQMLRLVLKTEALPQLQLIVSEYCVNSRVAELGDVMRPGLLYGEDPTAPQLQSLNTADVPDPCTVYFDMERVIDATLEQVSRCLLYADTLIDFELIRGRIALLLSSYSIFQEVAVAGSRATASVTFHFEPTDNAIPGGRTMIAKAEKHHDYISFSDLNLKCREREEIILRPTCCRQGAEVMPDRFSSIKYELDPNTPIPWLTWDPIISAFRGTPPVSQTYLDSCRDTSFDDNGPLGPQHRARRTVSRAECSRTESIVIRATILERHYKSELRLKKLIRARVTLKIVPWWTHSKDIQNPWSRTSQKNIHPQTLASHERAGTSRTPAWDVDFQQRLNATLPKRAKIPSSMFNDEASGPSEIGVLAKEAQTRLQEPTETEHRQDRFWFAEAQETPSAVRRMGKYTIKSGSIEFIPESCGAQGIVVHVEDSSQNKANLPAKPASKSFKNNEAHSATASLLALVSDDKFRHLDRSWSPSVYSIAGSTVQGHCPPCSPNEPGPISSRKEPEPCISSSSGSWLSSSSKAASQRSNSSSNSKSSGEACGCHPSSSPKSITSRHSSGSYADVPLLALSHDQCSASTEELSDMHEIANSLEWSLRDPWSVGSGDKWLFEEPLEQVDILPCTNHSLSPVIMQDSTDVDPMITEIQDYYNQMLAMKERDRDSDEMTLGMESRSGSSISSLEDDEDQGLSSEDSSSVKSDCRPSLLDQDNQNEPAQVAEQNDAVSAIRENTHEVPASKDDGSECMRCQSSQSTNNPSSSSSENSSTDSSSEDESSNGNDHDGDGEESNEAYDSLLDRLRKWTIVADGGRLIYRFDRSPFTE